MNQIPCRLAADGSPAVEIAGGPRLPLRQAVLRGGAGRDTPLVLGLRPEAFALASAATEASFDVTIRFVEPLGSDTLVFFTLGKSEIIARLPPLPHLKEGAAITLAVDPDRMHFFDARSERLIEPGFGRGPAMTPDPLAIAREKSGRGQRYPSTWCPTSGSSSPGSPTN